MIKSRTQTLAFLGGIAAIAVSATFALAIGAVTLTLVETLETAVFAERRLVTVPGWIQVSVAVVWFTLAMGFFLGLSFKSMIVRIIILRTRTTSWSKSIQQVTRRIVDDIQGQ